MTTLLILFIAVLGASVGSFLSVVIDRIHKKRKGIFFGHSECPHCRKRLRTIDLIPIVSFLWLKGKCRYCHKKIGIHYVGLEIFSAAVFVAIFWKFPFFQERDGYYLVNPELLRDYIVTSIYGVFLIAIFFYDLAHQKIPDLFLFPFIAVAVLGSLIRGWPEINSIFLAIMISLLFYGGQYLLSRGKWLGQGDVYLAIALAIMLGLEHFIASVALTYIIGGAISSVLLAMRKVNRKSHVPFAPFMVLGTLLTIFFGDELIEWYRMSLTL